MIDSATDQVQATFTGNSHRKMLFANYQSFVSDLQKVIAEPYVQWIDGSFVTTKIFPNDIDVVTFLPFESYDKNRAVLRNISTKYAFVDAYFVRVFPEGHPPYILCHSDRAEWFFQFSLTRPDPTGLTVGNNQKDLFR